MNNSDNNNLNIICENLKQIEIGIRDLRNNLSSDNTSENTTSENTITESNISGVTGSDITSVTGSTQDISVTENINNYPSDHLRSLNFKALKDACVTGRINDVKYILQNIDDNKLKLNAYTSTEESFIVYLEKAIHYGHLDLLKILINDRRWNLSIGKNLIKFACLYGHLNLVEYLLTFNEIPTDYECCLISAANKGFTNIVKIFIDNYIYLSKLDVKSNKFSSMLKNLIDCGYWNTFYLISENPTIKKKLTEF